MKITVLIISATMILFPLTYSQESSLIPFFPYNFEEEAFKHVDSLSSFGFRYANSKAETRTINYLKDFFSENQIVASIDTFKFRYFELQNLVIKVNTIEFNPINILINPYEATEYLGNGYVFYPDSFENYLSQNLGGRVVIASDEANLLMLYENKTARAIIILNENDFNSIKGIKNSEVSIQANGEHKIYKSCNLIATISPKYKTEKEIIISAHWDSYKGPGANDNATGIGVLLELAKYFDSIKDSLTCNIQFVAFGAEELGMIGSQAFIQKNYAELKNCMLVFNIDGVGGKGDTYIEMNGGVNNVPSEYDTSKNHSVKTLYSAIDYQGVLLNLGFEYSVCSNVPDWLKNIITGNCYKLNYNFIPAFGMGSDHQSFYPKGIVATNIGIASDNSTNHSPDDIPDSVNIEGLERSGKIVASVILQTMRNKSDNNNTGLITKIEEVNSIQNYPNPFSSAVSICFTLQKSGWTTLEIFNTQGELIEILMDQNLTSGDHQITWIPEALPAGIYFIQLKSSDFIETKKLIFNK